MVQQQRRDISIGSELTLAAWTFMAFTLFFKLVCGLSLLQRACSFSLTLQNMLQHRLATIQRQITDLHLRLTFHCVNLPFPSRSAAVAHPDF